ncbi:3',5'-cyclic AMP phosphodiesterase CpdA [Roseibium hamelinense]|uniref:3',5'-cyclic AMP phosphodiesterase CpdA n=1 Tax=Roseibium hamelinense TaxID=150831 RepID=A0A562TGJ9_9HYPH|nr:phosphodiesterase [Roseibium hamelinense]MTI46080.1 phosphodiesterase [Roseibium hamelinense]TWI92727.1 3',5'-cyclic AMP phosphodiesterase CpdA [Roseibium hamelinense]
MTLIAHITDLHLRPRGLPCYRVSDTNMLAERAIKALCALTPRPNAVVVTGDLTDRDDPREYAVARRLLKMLPMPVYVLPGNHDSTEGMRTNLTDFPGVQSADGEKLWYAADIGGLRMIVLDSHDPGRPTGHIGQAQLEQTRKLVLIALHHPPAQTGIKHMDAMGLRDSAELSAVLKGKTQVKRILCGHVHRPIITEFAGTIMTLAPSTCHQVALDLTADGPAMFNFEPPAYFLHDMPEDGHVVTHTAYVEAFDGPCDFFADEGIVWPGDERP